MAPRKSGSDTDPSTVAGTPSSELGGGGGTETFNNPLRNIFPAGWIESSEFQSFSGIINPLPSRPDPPTSGHSNSSPYITFEHPQTGDMVSYGLYKAPESGGPALSLSYDFFDQEWSIDKYPELGSSVGINFDISQSGVAVSGDYVGLVGAKTFDQAGSNVYRTDDILVLDTSETTPSWTREEGVLPTETSRYPATFAYDGSLYSLITDTSVDFDQTGTSYLVRYEFETGNIFTERTFPDSKIFNFSSNTPVLDGEAYLMGVISEQTNVDFIEGDYNGNGIEFYKYNIDDDEFIQLSDIDVLRYEGSPPGNTGFGNGDAFLIDGLIYYTDGYNFYGGVAQAVYSISKDEWKPLPFLPEGNAPYDDNTTTNNWLGSKAGVVKDGVYYFPQGNNDSSSKASYQVFLPSSFPTE